MNKLATLILIVLATQSFAQDSVKISHLKDVLVIGTRADKKTPVSFETITKADIQRIYQGQEIPILLDKSTSITSSSDGGHPQGYTYFRLRGIDQTRINMTLNGVPLNEPEDQGVYTSNYPGFTNDVQSIQIQRGVGTSSNGVASYAGSMSFQSQSGFEKGGEISLGYGSFNTMRFDAHAGTGLTSKGFAVFTDMSLFSSQGYKTNSGGNGYSFFLGGGHYGEKDIIKFTGFTGTSENHMAWLAVSEADLAKNEKTNYNEHDAPDHFTQSLAQLEYIRILTTNSRIATTVFYNRLDGMYDYFESGERSLTLASNFYGVISNYLYAKKNLKLTIGFNANEYNRSHYNAEDHIQDLGIPRYTNEGFKNEVSAFAKAGYDVGKFTLFGDAQYRYTNFTYEGDVQMNKLEWNFFNPKAGLMYNVSNSLNYYFSVGKTSREPTRTNLFGGYDNLVTLSDIKPEQVVDYELGTNVTKPRFALQANVYYMDFKNEITLLGALGSNGLPLMTNVTKSFRSGLEVDAKYSPFSQYLFFTTNLNYSYNRITDEGKEFQPLYTPVFVMNQDVTVDIHKFSIGVNAKYQSESYISFDNRYTTPEFIILGVNAAYVVNTVTFQLQLVNLTNQKYYTNGYVVNNERYFFANAGTSIYGTVKFRL